MRKWPRSKGYVAAGINCTLFSEAHPDANIYTQSQEIKEAIPFEEAIKDISAVSRIDEHSVPSVSAYGAHDRMQAFDASKHLDAALTQHGVPHEYIVREHSGHGLQNDNAQYELYMDKVIEYLDRYMA